MALILNTKLKRSLLGYVFTHPDESFYVRELSGLIGQDAGNLSRVLRELQEEGLFVSYVKGRARFYSLNKKYPLFPELKNIVFKTEGVLGSLRMLIEKFPGVSRAFIYGSFAKGKESKNSDVDLLVVGSFDYVLFTRAIRTLEAKLNREINFSYFPLDEFEAEKKKSGSFVNLVLKEKVIMLKGVPDV